MAGLAVLRSPLARSLCFRSVSRSLQWPRAYLTQELTPYFTSVNQGTFVTPERRQSGWSGRGFASGAAASERSSRDDGLQLTENAVRRLEELQSESPDKPLLLRLTVEGGGCSGFQYEFSLDSASRADDRVFEYGGAKVVTDDLSLQFLSGSIVDFETDLMRSGFVVAGNPNAASSCGCGSSFVAK